MNDILSNLNSQQKKAVCFGNGPLLILAGAGSGKTRALTYRAAYLISEKNISPQNLLLLTFTNKAAGEMKERIKKILDQSATKMPFAGTFHSFCVRILRIESNRLGYDNNFVIYDDNDQTDAIKNVLKKLGLSPKEYNPNSLSNIISSCKNELISALEYPQYARSSWQKKAAEVYLEYQSFLKKNQAMDFDDLIGNTVSLFKKFPEILGKYQNQYHYILVDEYQDTNRAQYLLTKLLSQRYKNITVVGDASQSIYGWRGANYQNLLNLKTDFLDLTIINMDQNYRSTQNILDSAYGVICHNTTHPILKLWTENQSGEKIQLYRAKTEIQEAEFIVENILSSQRQYSDFAVLYRTNAQSRVLEEVLLRAAIPYSLYGGTRFYQRKEIKDVLSYMRLVVNPTEEIALERIEKIGKNRARDFLSSVGKINPKILTSLEIMDEIFNLTGYLNLYDPKDEEDASRLENIKELRSVASEFTEINDFLENVSLVEQEYLAEKIHKGEKGNSVALMTLHSAKGLEFPVVFIVGMEEGIFPHSRSLVEKSQLEEERRLCYVGITRAKEKLFLTYTQRRLYFGTRMSNAISRFVCDIPEELLEETGSEV